MSGHVVFQTTKVDSRTGSWGYPFDRSEGSIVLALSWNDTGAALKHQGIDLIPMAGIQLTEKILGFRVTAQSKPNCNTNGACEMSIDFVVKRPGEVRFIVILVVIINCAYPFICRRDEWYSLSQNRDDHNFDILPRVRVCRFVRFLCSISYHPNQSIPFRCPKTAHSQGRRYHWNLPRCFVCVTLSQGDLTCSPWFWMSR